MLSHQKVKGREGKGKGMKLDTEKDSSREGRTLGPWFSNGRSPVWACLEKTLICMQREKF